MNLQGKIALITGGTKGIGAATAVEFARNGADVAITGRHNDDDATKTIAQVKALGRKCELLIGDIGKPADATHAVEQTRAKLGGIDVLVHSAGGAVAAGVFAITTAT